MKTNLVCLFLIILAYGCDSSKEKTKDCPLGKPTAIFSDSLPQVTTHQFEVEDQASLESVTFNNGIELVLSQSGCEEISQEFQFTIKDIPNKTQTVSWVTAGVEQFKYLASIGEQFAPFFMWATSIEDNKENFSLNTPVELGPGFFVTFNKVPGSDNNILIVKLHTEKQ